MSNCETIPLPDIEVEPHQVTEVLRCLIHTILFNRSLGAVKPREVDAELFDLTWVHCGDDEVDRLVESKVSQIQAWVDRSPGRQLSVRLSFFERRQQQGWFLRHEQRLYWEQWNINLLLVGEEAASKAIPRSPRRGASSLALQREDPTPPALLRAAAAAAGGSAHRKEHLQAGLEDCLTRIVVAVNEKREHIPPVVSGSALTFPFDIAYEAKSAGAEGAASGFGVDLVKRMLSSAHPPSVLH